MSVYTFGVPCIILAYARTYMSDVEAIVHLKELLLNTSINI